MNAGGNQSSGNSAVSGPPKQRGSNTCRFSAFLLLAASILHAPAIAEPVSYSFSGAEGGLFGSPIGMNLNGGLQLDPDAARSQTHWGVDDQGTRLEFTSALHELSGSYSDWTFTGIATVQISTGPEFWGEGLENFSQDYWIVRTPLTGPSVNDLTPFYLSLFFYSPPGYLMNSDTVFPPNDPLVAIGNPEDFQFALSFMNGEGDFETLYGRMFSIQSIPEPSSAALLALAIALLAFRKLR